MDYVTAADGVKLAYDVTGAGTPLLCLPGLTRNMEDFEPVVEAYADRAQVIRMDFRGRGASDYADPATYQVPQEAADVLALLDHLKLAEGHDPRHLARWAGGHGAGGDGEGPAGGRDPERCGPRDHGRGAGRDHDLYRPPPVPSHAGRCRRRHARRLCREFPERPARDLGRLRPPPVPGGSRRACTCATTRACGRPWHRPSPPVPWPPISGRFSTRSRVCRWA
jgi:hypothetical protein